MSTQGRKVEARCGRFLGMLAGLWLTAGCAPELPAPAEEERLATRESAVVSGNSLTPNGLSLNGLSLNGLSLNGLTDMGLATTSFASWFNSHPEHLSDMVMQYLVRCAVPSGQSRAWKNPSTSKKYTWAGGLGLTPDWAGGKPSAEAEEQLITACLAAHVNRFGVSMQVSLLGRDAKGALLPTTSEESTSYSQKEATFFGNAFRNEGFFVCKDPVLKLGSSQSTLRACSIESQDAGASSACPPIVLLGTCGSSITCTADSSAKDLYAACSYNGKSYQVLSARIRPEDIYLCGDGICQISESCGTGKTASSCFNDCGACP